MKAIRTKYHGQTDTLPARVTASDEDGNRITVSYDSGTSGETTDAHARAAVALCRKMNWTGELLAGALRDGYAFVFTNSARYDITKEVE